MNLALRAFVVTLANDFHDTGDATKKPPFLEVFRSRAGL